MQLNFAVNNFSTNSISYNIFVSTQSGRQRRRQRLLTVTETNLRRANGDSTHERLSARHYNTTRFVLIITIRSMTLPQGNDYDAAYLFNLFESTHTALQW